MGLPFIDLVRYTKKQRQAAKEMWSFIKTGISFEVPVSLSTDDDTMRAVEVLLKSHPEVTLGHERKKKDTGPDGSSMVTFQSRGLVLGLRQSFNVSADGLETLAKSGYHPESANLIKLFEQHEGFMKRPETGQDVNAAIKRAQGESAERNRIELVGGGKLEVPPERTATPELREQALAKLVLALKLAKGTGPTEPVLFHVDIERGTHLTWRAQYRVEMLDGWSYNIQWRELPADVRTLYAETIGWRVRGGRVEKTEYDKPMKDEQFTTLYDAEKFAQERLKDIAADSFVVLDERIRILGDTSDDPTQYVLFQVLKKEVPNG